MVKRLWMLLLVLYLLPVCAVAEQLTVVDEAGLYTESEIAAITQTIEDIRSRFDMDAVVLTTYDVPYANGDNQVTVRYADAWYENHGCGLGEDRAGVLMILDMTNRYNYMSTAGVMIDYITESREEAILSAADSDLATGRYGSAMIKQMNRLVSYLQKGREEGSFRFDEVTGERLTGLYNKLTRSELGLSALVGAIASVAMGTIVSGSYKLRWRTYRYTGARECKLTRDDEHFLRRTVSRTPIVRSSGGGGGHGGFSGGSGVHTSSGGMSHGGGGHHF